MDRYSRNKRQKCADRRIPNTTIGTIVDKSNATIPAKMLSPMPYYIQTVNKKKHERYNILYFIVKFIKYLLHKLRL